MQGKANIQSTVDTSEVEAKINDLAKNMLPEAIEDALKEASLICVGTAKEKCPVDTGQLRNSITYKVTMVAGQGGYAEIGSNMSYAAYVELGTGIYADGGRQGGWAYRDAEGNTHFTMGSKPHPYLKPAVNDNKDRIINCFKERL